MNRTWLLVITLSILSTFGCATMPNSPNKIVFSNNFNVAKHRSIAILPFQSSGKEGSEYSITDKFSMHCMESGFIVIERTQLEQVFKELKLELTGILSKSDTNRIGKILNLDMIVFGSVGYAQSVGGRYVIDSESARFVDVSSGEVLISIYVNEADNVTNSYSEAMSLLLKDKLNEMKNMQSENKK